jgi:Domain of unknown function (DUF4158)
MSTDSRRLSILTAQEIDDLYGLPRFTENDRRLHFDLSQTERDLVEGVRTMSAAVHLILQLGYLKAKCQFFVFAREAVLGDLEHILRRHFPVRDIAEIKTLSKPTRLEQQQIVLKLFGYRLCDAAAKAELEQKVQRVAILSTLPIFILREISQYLTHQRVLAPGYTHFQKVRPSFKFLRGGPKAKSHDQETNGRCPAYLFHQVYARSATLEGARIGIS